MSNKNLAVEGVRGLAALAVILSHSALTFWPYLHGDVDELRSGFERWVFDSPFGFFYSGAGAVSVFFVLSGFVLGRSVLGQTGLVRSLPGMVVRRYFRLMLPILATCLLAWAVFAFVLPQVDRQALGEWIRLFGSFDFSLTSALRQGTVETILWGASDYNWALWTMRVEFFGSLLVYGLAALLVYWSRPGWLLPVAALACLWLVPGGDGMYYALFVFGIWLAASEWTVDSRVVAALLLLAGLYLVGYHEESRSYRFIEQHLALTWRGESMSNYDLANALGGMLIVWAALKSPWLGQCLSGRAMAWLGRLSFSAYLLHMLVLATVAPAVFNALRPELSYTGAALLSLLASLLAIYLCSLPYARWVDETSIHVSRKAGRLVWRR
ncbi:acyltransferase [Pseudogulbenkiania sp. MAI-1]|uniref:acyltransferase family protein n=1 Tax=Pseudogulbenkiania sp. MAI-1 TaxID=990370 RepID=UPI00045EA96F|nr:acyltransferase [Pseudogulbenkiania sp. MAI-1]